MVFAAFAVFFVFSLELRVSECDASRVLFSVWRGCSDDVGGRLPCTEAGRFPPCVFDVLFGASSRLMFALAFPPRLPRAPESVALTGLAVATTEGLRVSAALGFVLTPGVRVPADKSECNLSLPLPLS